MLPRTYTPLWNKYRPAILKMMLDSSNEPQQYKLSSHEFKALNSKQRGGYSFTLKVARQRAQNDIRDCPMAQDLLEVLRLSRRGSELIDLDSYEIVLDKQFVLHVNKTSPAPIEQIDK